VLREYRIGNERINPVSLGGGFDGKEIPLSFKNKNKKRRRRKTYSLVQEKSCLNFKVTFKTVFISFHFAFNSCLNDFLGVTVSILPYIFLSSSISQKILKAWMTLWE